MSLALPSVLLQSERERQSAGPRTRIPLNCERGDLRVWVGHSDTKTLLRCYSHELEAVRGGRQIAQEIAQMDADFAG